MSNYNELKLTYQDGRQETITLTGNIIGPGEYQERDIVAVEVPEIVERIEEYAFCDNNNLSSITLSEGLMWIGDQAFQHGVYTAVTIPSTVTYIGWNSFNTRDEQFDDQHTFTVTCLAQTPPELNDEEGITFGDPELLIAIYVPAGSVSAYKAAWRDYASKIQGGAPADNTLTNLNIKAAYVGTDEVAKMYLGSDVVWAQEEPDPCEEYEEGTQERCECEGRYWWGNDCHDMPEPILKLTFDFPTDGEVKLFNDANGISDIMLNGNSIMGDINPEGYFSYDTSVYSGPQDVYYYYGLGYDIQDRQFYNLPNLVAIHIPGSFSRVGSYAFAAEYGTPSNVTSITLDEGIERLEGRAFEGIRNVSAITIPQSVEYIGRNCFYKFGVYAPVVYTFLSNVPPTFDMGEDGDLGLPNSIWILVPCDSKEAYNQATNSYYDGRFVCNYVEIMEKTPLTFEITSVGTGETGSIGLRLSGDTGTANKRRLSYYLNHEGTETQGNFTLNETASNSAITSMLSGLTVGDKIEFWCYSTGNQSGMSVSTSAFEYFVTTAGVTAKVYGNVNSLLYSWLNHGKPVPQTAEVAPYAFYGLFQSKTGFTFGSPDELQHIVLPVPANGLQDSIYREMFYGCTSMTTPPNLPATTLADNCYRSMFYNCTSLTTAPSLPATTLANYCYMSMFNNCTSLTTAPELPATTLTQYCYYYMFAGCTSLTTAPGLPASRLANYCYQYMFRNCTSLMTAPELPATELTGTTSSGCYRSMFQGCTSLNYVKCLATNPSRYTTDWLSGVASSGTFVKHPNASWSTGASGIPDGWTIEDAVIA